MTGASPSEAPGRPTRVLAVDDDASIRRLIEKTLADTGALVETAASGESGLALLKLNAYDVVLTDITLPGMTGLDFLKAARERDPDLPVVLLTGSPDLGTAIAAIEHGAFRYLLKPVAPAELKSVVQRAGRLRALALLRRRATETIASGLKEPDDKSARGEELDRALSSIYMLYQPIVSLREKRIIGREALMRSREPGLSSPGAVLDAAQELKRLHDVGRTVRRRVAEDTAGRDLGTAWFVNLHPQDLADEDLFDGATPMAQNSRNIVLEITEKASLEGIADLGGKLARLRSLGYRLALDDLGAGYSGLSTLAKIEPEVVKLDMSFVRDVVTRPAKRAVIRSTVQLCKEMGMSFICEGVETAAERDALVEMGCDLFQGFLFGPPELLAASPVAPKL